MNQVLIPARPVPPGNILRRELEARGWTQKDFSEMIHLSEKAISGIVNGAKQITPEAALKFAAAMGTSPEFWINLEANYRLQLARKRSSDDELAAIAERGRERLSDEMKSELVDEWDEQDENEAEAIEATSFTPLPQATEQPQPLPAPHWPHLSNAAYRALMGAGLEIEAQQVTEQLFAGWLESNLNQAQAALISGHTKDALTHLNECHRAVLLPGRASQLMGVLGQAIVMLSEQVEEIIRVRSGMIDARSVRYRISQAAEESAHSSDIMQEFFNEARADRILHERAQPVITSLIEQRMRHAE